MKRTTKGESTRGKRRGRGPAADKRSNVERILVGVRIEPRLVKVMKALAELHDFTLGELIENVFWNALEGNSAFAEKNGKLSAEVKHQITSLKQVYGVNYDLKDLMKPKKESA